nr:hypothetical protein [Tanacetum cinerariifolium]
MSEEMVRISLDSMLDKWHGISKGIANQNGTGNVVAARAEGTRNGNQARCYNCRGLARIQLQAEEFDFMAAAGDLDETEEVNANCILMANLYMHPHLEEQYTDLLKPIPEPQLVPQNDNHVTSVTPKETLELAQESREKMRFLKKEIKPANYAKINHLSGAKFVRDFKSLANEADESLDKQKSLELKIERLLKASVSHDIMSIVQIGFVDVPSNLQTKLDRMKEKLKLCIIKKEKEYAVLWNNYHLKTTYKNLFDSITSNRAHAKLHDLIYENAQLRAWVFENTSESIKTTSGTSVTPHVDKPKLSTVTPYSKKLHASIMSHSIPQPREFNVVKHRNVIAPGMFKINPSQTPRVDLVPNKQSSVSIRTNLITDSQRYVIVKENVSSNTVTTSST